MMSLLVHQRKEISFAFVTQKIKRIQHFIQELLQFEKKVLGFFETHCIGNLKMCNAHDSSLFNAVRA